MSRPRLAALVLATMALLTPAPAAAAPRVVLAFLPVDGSSPVTVVHLTPRAAR